MRITFNISVCLLKSSFEWHGGVAGVQSGQKSANAALRMLRKYNPFNSPARKFFATFHTVLPCGHIVFKRLLHMIPLLLGVSLLTFLLMSLAPGDYFTALSQNPQISPETIAHLKAQFHLDRPWYVQYFYWFKSVLSGDFGYSMAYKIPATSLIIGRLWNTFLLSFFAHDHCVGHRPAARHLGGG